ncbi:MAG: adenylate cyclase [Lentisphaerae bacterium GWF2_44_16]|nr:MAG: adenylate cyclase [Lentisphaerae bacterium GWF2_44_16]
MAKEIERKYLLKDDSWRNSATGHLCSQGYISTDKNCVVRIRVSKGKGYITIKGKLENISRPEYEYEIPLKDAQGFLEKFCGKTLIEKTRYALEYKGHLWEIDEFHGNNSGLILAEIELENEEEKFELPEWAGKDVTDDFRYYNSYLAEKPFTTW